MSSAKEECESLMNSLMPFAEQMLTKHREFFPFGGTMGDDGEIKPVAASTEDEQPPSAELIELLNGAYRQQAQAGQVKATALVYDIQTIPPGKEEKQDAIAVSLDHRDDFSAVVVFPYAFDSDGALEIETPFAVQGENKIFGQA